MTPEQWRAFALAGAPRFVRKDQARECPLWWAVTQADEPQSSA